jgi:uncharacterized protein (DUF924 family)
MSTKALDTLTDDAKDVLDFWFGTLESEQWWKRDDKVDIEIATRFASVYDRLANAIPAHWLSSPRGQLAAIIVLDQFPRNIFRDHQRTFVTDAKALDIAGKAIAAGDDMKLSQVERGIMYMPYQHSEDGAVQERSVELFTALGDDLQLDFAIMHKQIIDRFGRFPHRNKILGRDSYPEEIEFLKQPGLFW